VGQGTLRARERRLLPAAARAVYYARIPLSPGPLSVSLAMQNLTDAEPAAGKIAAGESALREGDWAAARAAFEAVLATAPSAPVAEAAVATAEALDGLGRALWWLGDPEGARAARQRAYAGFRRRGEVRRAVRIALWLAGEYGAAWGNEAAANGWVARAERLLRDLEPGAEAGWLELARAERAADPAAAPPLAREALEIALRSGDPDLELRALAALGLAEISLGSVDEGLARFDEAMAGGTGGEPSDLATLAELYCALLAACDLVGDERRPQQWGQVIATFVRDHGHVPLLSFCRCCCADMFAASGRMSEAEQELTTALAELRAAGQRSRCVHPAARLAEWRVAQGRLSEAEQLLAGHEAMPEAVQAAVSLRMARGEHEAAAALLERRLDEVGRDTLLAVPLLALLVQSRLAGGDLAAARAATDRLREVAERYGRPRAEAAAALAAGRLDLAAGDARSARAWFERAVEGYTLLRLGLDAARARLELARATAPSSLELAADLALMARTELGQLGATRDADAASALLRELGVRGRAGPRDHGVLSRREVEVLRLLGQGLSNAEIGTRLYISPRTAEHHVGRILAKLGLRNRGEAAGYAVRNLPEPGLE
jgi:DNA-binding CsgD family transcriptional regulator/tetratricopeptide (TPR) repeat protein